MRAHSLGKLLAWVYRIEAVRFESNDEDIIRDPSLSSDGKHLSILAIPFPALPMKQIGWMFHHLISKFCS
jgi:hypothetical protein